jgi:hypothetical protein
METLRVIKAERFLNKAMKLNMLHRFKVRWRRKIILSSFFLIFCGCNASIRPNVSQAEFLTPEAKLPASVLLVASDEFRTYHYKKFDFMGLKEWEIELGPAAVDTFFYSLQSRFSQVDLTTEKPNISAVSKSDKSYDLVVVPQIQKTNTTEPIVFKFENYSVSIVMDVQVFHSDGEMIYTRSYEGRGAKAGAIGYESPGHAAHPVASRKALRDAVDKATIDLVSYLKSQSVAKAL